MNEQADHRKGCAARAVLPKPTPSADLKKILVLGLKEFEKQEKAEVPVEGEEYDE